MRTGWVESNTTSAVSPDMEGKRACSRFMACWDGVSPAENLFSKWVPTSWAMAMMPIRSAIQAKSTRRRWS